MCGFRQQAVCICVSDVQPECITVSRLFVFSCSLFSSNFVDAVENLSLLSFFCNYLRLLESFLRELKIVPLVHSQQVTVPERTDSSRNRADYEANDK